jgi:hypothetical protein
VNELMRDLRTFSRLDEAEFTTVDVGETIDAVLLLFKHKMNGFIRRDRRITEARAWLEKPMMPGRQAPSQRVIPSTVPPTPWIKTVWSVA